MRWAGHVACIVKNKNVYRVLVGKPEYKDNLPDLSVDERTVLKLILKKQDRKACS